MPHGADNIHRHHLVDGCDLVDSSHTARSIFGEATDVVAMNPVVAAAAQGAMGTNNLVAPPAPYH